MEPTNKIPGTECVLTVTRWHDQFSRTHGLEVAAHGPSVFSRAAIDDFVLFSGNADELSEAAAVVIGQLARARIEELIQTMRRDADTLEAMLKTDKIVVARPTERRPLVLSDRLPPS